MKSLKGHSDCSFIIRPVSFPIGMMGLHRNPLRVVVFSKKKKDVRVQLLSTDESLLVLCTFSSRVSHSTITRSVE